MRKRLKVRVGCGVLAAALLGGLSAGDAQAYETDQRTPGAVSSAEVWPEGCGPVGNLRDVFEDVAEAAGVSVEELQAALAEGQTVAQVATANGVDPATVVDAALADLEAHVAAKVAEGRLTQAQADSLLAKAEEKVTQAINTALPVRPDKGDDDDAPFPSIVDVVDDVATATGVSVEDLKAALANGQTVAQVAEANGVDQQTLVDAALADLRAALADKVEDGKLSQAQADAWLATAGAFVARVINTPVAAPPPPPAPTDPADPGAPSDPGDDDGDDGIDDGDDGRPDKADRLAAKRARWAAFLNALREAAERRAERWEDHKDRARAAQAEQWRKYAEASSRGRGGDDDRQSARSGRRGGKHDGDGRGGRGGRGGGRGDRR